MGLQFLRPQHPTAGNRIGSSQDDQHYLKSNLLNTHTKTKPQHSLHQGTNPALQSKQQQQQQQKHPSNLTKAEKNKHKNTNLIYLQEIHSFILCNIFISFKKEKLSSTHVFLNNVVIELVSKNFLQ